MSGPTMDEAVSDLRSVADVDFIDVSFVAESIREDLQIQNEEDLRSCAMEAIKRLMSQGIYPGDYDQPTALSFWPGEPDEHLRRIEAEWIAMGHTPTLEHPICWFGLEESNTA